MDGTMKRPQCKAWKYPGHQSWDCELSISGGVQCVLDEGHVNDAHVTPLQFGLAVHRAASAAYSALTPDQVQVLDAWLAAHGI